MEDSEPLSLIQVVGQGMLEQVKASSRTTAGGRVVPPEEETLDSKGAAQNDEVKYTEHSLDQLEDTKNNERRIHFLFNAARKAYLRRQKMLQRTGMPSKIEALEAQKLAIRQNYTIKHSPKNAETTGKLFASLENSFLLASLGLSQEQKMQIVLAMKAVKKSKGDTLFKEKGSAKFFYVVMSGSAIGIQKNEIFCEFGPMEVFGEVSVFHESKRLFTVKAKDNCELFKIDFSSFHAILAQEPSKAEEMKKQLAYDLLEFPLLKAAGLEGKDALQLASFAKRITIPRNQVIVRKGEVGEAMFFISKGKVRSTKPGSSEFYKRNADFIKSKHIPMDENANKSWLRFDEDEVDRESIVEVEDMQHRSLEFADMEYFGEGALLSQMALRSELSHMKSKAERQAFIKANKPRRSANVYAVVDTELIVVDIVAFNKAVKSKPRLLSLCEDNLGVRILKSSPLVSSMKTEYADFLLEEMEVLRVRKDGLVLRKGDDKKLLIVVGSGELQLKREAREFDKKHFVTGDAIGFDIMFSQDNFPFDLVAKTESKLFVIAKEKLDKQFGKSLVPEDMFLSEFVKPSETNQRDTVIRNFSTFSKKVSVLRPGTVIKRVRNAPRTRISNASESMEKENAKLFSKKKLKTNLRAKSGDVLKTRYKTLGLIGMGTFGKVYLLQHRTTRKTFALKQYGVKEVVMMDQQKQITTERNILQSLKHPFILRFVDSFKTKQELFLLTEFVSGGELFDRVAYFTKKDDFLPDEEAKFYISCVLDAFFYLHKRKIVYRDLKTENLMIDSNGFIRLVDFGFAKVCKHRTTTRLGTPEYLCPELIMQHGYDQRADIWACGILLYEMMTGFTPFYSESNSEMMDCILNEEPEFGEDFPETAADLIANLLSKDPRYRPSELEIRDHDFFSDVDFEQLRKKKVSPPFVPEITPVSELQFKSEEELKIKDIDIDAMMGEKKDKNLTMRDYEGWYDLF